jgi:lipopolysaccharide transport system ATP-binding protein
MTDIAIKVQNLSKCYHIYDNPRDRLKQFVAPRLQRLFRQAPKQYFREFWALKDVSFEIKKGETVGIIGRNGSGKSTLLQMICGTLTPTSGNIQTHGRIAALLELGSGFNPEFTGRENVYMNASVLGLSNKEIDDRFSDIVAFADIGQFIEQPVKTYSSGMMVRLAFAVIAHVDADILIVDEALAVGDAVFVQKCNSFIRKFLNNGTLLFVSHATQLVLELCDRSIWLKQGEVSQDGEAKDVVRHYSAYVHQQINADLTVSVKERSFKGRIHSPQKNFDKRRALLAESNIKFEIELFGFDFNSVYWGVGGATIIDIELFDENGIKLTVVEDCGSIVIRVHCLAKVELLCPVVGISIRNQRGVELISENSYLTYLQDQPPKIDPGKEFYAVFKFFLPYLPPGEYTLGAALADGPTGGHVQHHRRDDALRFTVLSSHLVYGLFAMPLEDCSIILKN